MVQAAERDPSGWIGDFFATIEEHLDASIRRRLRKDLYSRFGTDIRQDVFLLMVQEKDAPGFAGIDGSNWHTAEPFELLRRWAFSAVRFLTYARIRESQRYDHGGTEFDIASVWTDAAASENEKHAAALLAQCPIRGASMVLSNATDRRIAEELGISKSGVRVIRHRVRKWAQQQISQ